MLPPPMRRGRFRITAEFLRDRYAEIARLVFARVAVVRAEMIFCADVIEYEGLSDEFDEVPAGEESPQYEILFSQDAAGVVTLVKFNRLP